MLVVALLHYGPPPTQVKYRSGIPEYRVAREALDEQLIQRDRAIALGLTVR